MYEERYVRLLVATQNGKNIGLFEIVIQVNYILGNQENIYKF